MEAIIEAVLRENGIINRKTVEPIVTLVAQTPTHLRGHLLFLFTVAAHTKCDANVRAAYENIIRKVVAVS